MFLGFNVPYQIARKKPRFDPSLQDKRETSSIKNQ